MKSQLLILDFGSQYTQLIARSVRELGVYCQIIPGTASLSRLRELDPKAIILSGGPASVNAEGSPKLDPGILQLGIPVLGICYGMQLLAVGFGGKLGGWGKDLSADTKDSSENFEESAMREFGAATIKFSSVVGPFSCFAKETEQNVWMSHGDKVVELPPGFTTTASTSGSPIAAFANTDANIYGVQFHPEVHHTPGGKKFLSAFLFDSAKLVEDWDPKCFVSETVEGVKKKVPTGNVVCGLSGGVDSTVAAVLVNKAIGHRLHCIFVDNGLLREDEAEQVQDSFRELDLNVHFVDASERFLSELEGVVDPEQKRKIIGRVFIEVFEDEASRISEVEYLVQGTLYPDVIESVSVIGKSATIKSHHNVGGLIDDMKLGLIEPLRELFKDEVRKIGRQMDIPEPLVARQPFPGPGLAVRCIGELTPGRLTKLRCADKIVREEIESAGLMNVIWQYFAVLLPVQSVGVMGDGRTFDECIGIRAVTSRDGMTADWYYFPEDVLKKMSSRIVNETDGVNRVVLDVSSKPPATIEWE